MARRRLALIPARGGSKGIPGKNTAIVGGRALISWTIQAARDSGAIERVIVSTDSEEIANVARQHDAEVPFLRPAELATDEASSAAVVLHALEWLASNEGYRPDVVVLLQCTSPLRTTEDIDAACALLEQTGAASVVSVTATPHHPYWTRRIDEHGRLADFMETGERCTRRQHLPPAYVINGAIYAARRDEVIRHGAVSPEPSYAYVMPRERSLDIDTPWDLYLADLVLRDRRLGAEQPPASAGSGV